MYGKVQEISHPFLDFISGFKDKNAALRKGQDLNQRYNEEILELKTDPEAVERAVRETLKFAKPEETIYSFESRGDKRR